MPSKKKDEYELKTPQTVVINTAQNPSRRILQIGKFIDRGSFGVVHHATMLETSRRAIIKCEMSDCKNPQLKQERNVYKLVTLSSNVTKLIFSNKRSHGEF